MRTIQAPVTAWECSGAAPKWKAHPLVENYGPHCVICGRPHPPLRPQRRSPFSSRLTTVALITVLGGLTWGLWGRGLLQPFLPTSESVSWSEGASSLDALIPSNSPDRFSSGERRLLRYQSNRDADFAAQAFAARNYEQAIYGYEKAMKGDRRDPEVEIYRNNAQARAAGIPLIIAVVVPIDSAASSAEEMLRGVADAQTRLNQANGVQGRLIEVVIANDGNDPAIAQGVAQTLVDDPRILGVIGHNSSAASAAAVKEYEPAGLAMLAPTSGSTFITSPVFFRVTLSTTVLSQSLASYARNQLKSQQIAIFYNPNDPFSRSMQETFATAYADKGGQTVQTIDLSQPNFDATAQLKSLQVDTIALFPDPPFLTTGLGIAAATAELRPNRPFKLIGSTTLYRPQTLTSGGDSIKAITLAVPWISNTPYGKQALQRWGGQVSWRTAMSYDATMALSRALSDKATRPSVLKMLRSVKLSANETSGSPLQFSAQGERIGQPKLVQAMSGNGGPAGSGLVFKPIEVKPSVTKGS